MPMHADGPNINLPGNFPLTLEMKIQDDNVVIMCGLLLAEAIRMAGAALVAAKTPSLSKQNVTTESQQGQEPQGYQEVVQQPRSSEAEFEVCTVSNN